ncbi:interferon-related developmental regulator-domain-containing protein [Zalerion maritima]|uniref:Interferon-related developmental regulator-domain-containing protein n=1 Tax=Zalerion maritima TaxID=339359 RepID=A0AAD5RJD9_9PEZI|nr:interferon-related developmental regulator-domain-containing protein [Zalerion maritima]
MKHDKRTRKREKQDKSEKEDPLQVMLMRLLSPNDADMSDGSGTPGRSRNGSRVTSRGASKATSRVTSGRATPHPESRVETDDDDSEASQAAAAIQTLNGEELWSRILQVLSSKTSSRGAEHKMKKKGSRASKKVDDKNGANTPTGNQKLDALNLLCRFLREDVLACDIAVDKIHELHRSLVNSIKHPGSPEETDLALVAFALVAVTFGADESLLSHKSLLKAIISSDTAAETTKAFAMYALTCTIRFSGSSDKEPMDSLLEYLLEIVESDGAFIEAHDSALVVGAAMEAWAYIATFCDLHSHSINAMEAFVDQLDSDEASIRIQAASNIALMFDISRILEEEAKEEADKNEDPDASNMLDLYDDPHKVAQKIRSLSRIRPSNTKEKHATKGKTMEYAATSMELKVGYGYDTTTSWGRELPDGGVVMKDKRVHQGYSEVVKIGELRLVVRTWAEWSRVCFLRKLLGSGFVPHFYDNDRVSDDLDDALILEAGETWDGQGQVDNESTDIHEYWENEREGEET